MNGNPQKLPSLDGWRMVSISLVLLAHSTYTSGFPAGWSRAINGFDTGLLGVRFFFVISGFLITRLLLQEHEKNGFISLQNFYVRRALRILPVYFLFLLVLGLLTKYSQNTASWLANLTFTTNFFPTPFPTGHLWSLAVEEQFYLLWPWFLVLALKHRKGHAILLKVLIVSMFIAPLVRLADSKQWYPPAWHSLFQSGSFFEHFDSLAFGCMAAILITHRQLSVEVFYQKNLRQIAWAGVLLIFAPAALRFLHLSGRFQTAGFDSIQGIGFSLLLLHSILYPNLGLYRFLNWKWVSQIGVLSYSIYIWQQMFCGTDKTVFGVKDAWWVNFPVWILVTLLVACASYYLLEKPFLKLRARLRSA